jgi:hypothetical protein
MYNAAEKYCSDNFGRAFISIALYFNNNQPIIILSKHKFHDTLPESYFLSYFDIG